MFSIYGYSDRVFVVEGCICFLCFVGFVFSFFLSPCFSCCCLFGCCFFLFVFFSLKVYVWICICKVGGGWWIGVLLSVFINIMICNFCYMCICVNICKIFLMAYGHVGDRCVGRHRGGGTITGYVSTCAMYMS